VRALVAPGQGAQKPGMLIPWLRTADARDQLERWSQVAGLDLIRHGTESPAHVIRDTAVAQPLLTATALLSHRASETPFDVVAGHSVGEFAAAAIAGVLTEDAAIHAVAVRGRAMAACAEAHPSGMAAVIGGEPAAVLDAIQAAGAAPANFNGPGQIVAGGPVDALDRLAAAPPRRARVIRLDVAGAFHTELMAQAEEALRGVLAEVETHDPATPFVVDRDGTALTDGRQVVEAIIQQVARPVRWDLVLERFATLGVTRHFELAPAGVLTGLAKRGLKQAVLEQALTPEAAA
jgi:[acyl-carrier-protein] S-malonyltransferase